MGRRPPARVRSGLRRRPRPGESRAVVPGLSARAVADVARVEERHLAPGATYAAWRGWRALVHGARGRVIYPNWEVLGCPCCSSREERATLERVTRALPPRSARELRVVLAPLDAAYLGVTVPDPYAAPGAPWWERRIGHA
ncbi:hypothetical protein [Streptomyces sp. GSL17-111]|uniref:hypothetical protein n=1 Tax=Streptomyces sp. GSL17-111 TaxID=3121596 RepID=UPI0030F44F56